MRCARNQNVDGTTKKVAGVRVEKGQQRSHPHTDPTRQLVGIYQPTHLGRGGMGTGLSARATRVPPPYGTSSEQASSRTRQKRAVLHHGYQCGAST